MSLLGLLEDAPAVEIPEVPVWSVPPWPGPDKPLTPSERARWNEITQGLGDLSITEVGTPIWDKLSAAHPTLFDQDQPWVDDDWITIDFEHTWSMAAPAWPPVVLRPRRPLDEDIAPPPGFRSPIAERRDRSGLGDEAMERVLAGLRRL